MSKLMEIVSHPGQAVAIGIGNSILESTKLFPEDEYFHGNPFSQNDSEQDQLQAVVDFYDYIDKATKAASKYLPLPKIGLNHQRRYYDIAFRLAENRVFWYTQNRIWMFQDKDLISAIPDEERQKIIIDSLTDHTELFSNFSRLRLGTIKLAHKTRSNGEPLLPDNQYHFLLTGSKR